MLVEITHITEYNYSEPVFLEPHIFRLVPRAGFFCHPISLNIKITPNPFSLFTALETDGSTCYSASFTGLTEKLVIEHKTKLEIIKYNPLNFVIYPTEFNNLPFNKNDNALCGLEPYMYIYETDNLIQNIATDIYKETKGNTLDFLNSLNIFLNKSISYKKRLTGDPQKGTVTLRTKEGSCRDMALLFMELSRYMNIPCRFTSGYSLHEESDKYEPELHAWTEAYIPGAGWVGYDPTNAIICFGTHIPLVSSFDPTLTLPVAGSYRGDASSEISYRTSCKILSK